MAITVHADYVEFTRSGDGVKFAIKKTCLNAVYPVGTGAMVCFNADMIHVDESYEKVIASIWA